MCGRLGGIAPTTFWLWGDRPHKFGAYGGRWTMIGIPAYLLVQRLQSVMNTVARLIIILVVKV